MLSKIFQKGSLYVSDEFVRQKLKQYFSSRGYNKIHLQQTLDNVRKMERSELLNDKIELSPKDPQTVFVCTWHPKLKQLSSLLHQNYKILSADAKLSKTFTLKSIVAFRRKKNLGNFLCRSNIRPKCDEKRMKQCCKCLSRGFI